MNGVPTKADSTRRPAGVDTPAPAWAHAAQGLHAADETDVGGLLEGGLDWRPGRRRSVRHAEREWMDADGMMPSAFFYACRRYAAGIGVFLFLRFSD